MDIGWLHAAAYSLSFRKIGNGGIPDSSQRKHQLCHTGMTAWETSVTPSTFGCKCIYHCYF